MENISHLEYGAPVMQGLKNAGSEEIYVASSLAKLTQLCIAERESMGQPLTRSIQATVISNPESFPAECVCDKCKKPLACSEDKIGMVKAYCQNCLREKLPNLREI